MGNLIDFEGLKISLASPETIRSWSHGEVVKPETINYRTLKPEKDGLFCERIFGPTRDFECYCGKYKKIRYRGIICDKCGVEVTRSRVRRERMGHINLISPVVHMWFFRGAPSLLSTLLEMPLRSLESVIYFASYLVTDVDIKKQTQVLSRLKKELSSKKEKLAKAVKVKIAREEKAFQKKKKKFTKKQKKEVRKTEISKLEQKLREKIEGLRTNLVLEQTSLEENYKSFLEQVKKISQLSLLSEEEYLRYAESGAGTFFRANMGAEALLEVLSHLDLDKLATELRTQAVKVTGARRIKIAKRLRLVERMRRASIRPEWMIIKVLPVIPPDLRPMVQLTGGRFATSDLNDLYRRVINRNNRLKKLIDLGAPEIILRNEKRMLQESVDSLIDSSRQPRRKRRGSRELRSLSDMLRGKQGRFRRNLLGKRVDYSGRSVIVVGPSLKLNQTGLPKGMALEMFKPFVLRELIARGLAPNVKSAKTVLEKRTPEVFDILEAIAKEHPVLLNRAPTLHRLGIQAFYPVLVEGNAISIHPCVCAGYNADFDGDQMAVHVPLSKKAIEEANNLMLSIYNLLRPADGVPLTIPNKEMALGCFYLTTIDKNAPNVPTVFSDTNEVILAYHSGKINLRTPIFVRFAAGTVETTVGRILFNEVLPEKLRFVNDAVKERTIKALITRALRICSNAEVIEMIDAIKDFGFFGSTISGISVAPTDCKVSSEKRQVIEDGERRVEDVERSFKRGLITLEEQQRLQNEVWMEVTDKLADLTWQQLGEENPIRMILESDASRATRDHLKQLAGMRGLVTDPTGKIVELPTKSNYREGLSAFEYFTSCRGARKGLADKAIKTAQAGYLTRRLVDIAHDVIIRIPDCGTSKGIEIARHREGRTAPFAQRILGRVLAKRVIDRKTKKILLGQGEEITEENVGRIEKSGVEKVMVRSVLTCEAKHGVCVACYGRDLSCNQMVKIGTPVGVMAAQSIGEPGTQLTLRTFHLGGIVGLDITQGLPRVEELFEARTPKVLAPVSEIGGRVKIEEVEEGYKATVRSVGIKPAVEREYLVPTTLELRVSDREKISAGTPLSSGHLDINTILETQGLVVAQEYIVDEAQKVYESQGVPINDKHFEVIVKKMCDKVRIISSGDTDLLPRELVERYRFEEENARVLAEGGEPATARVVILGLIRAALQTESFLSAASFQETTNVLTKASIEGKTDWLLGLKENVIIGRLIPTSPERAKIEV
jgi:DNA-directed RNA polymerase subunit beta'